MQNLNFIIHLKIPKKLLKNLKSKKPLSFISIHKDRYRKALFKVFDLNNILKLFKNF